MLKEQCTDGIEGLVHLTEKDQKEELLTFFKNVYAGLKPGGKLDVKFANLADNGSLESFAKLHGFGNIVAVEGGIQASKIVFGAAPAKIKRKNKTAAAPPKSEPEAKANPWATLKKDDKELINEE